MSGAVLVMLGGFCGAVARFAISQWMSRHWPSDWPLGTWTVNMAGSFFLGWIASTHSETNALLWGTGFMGAFTTFSTFKLEGVRLWTNGKLRVLMVYYGITYTMGIGLAFAGYGLGLMFQ